MVKEDLGGGERVVMRQWRYRVLADRPIELLAPQAAVVFPGRGTRNLDLRARGGGRASGKGPRPRNRALGVA